MDGRGLCFIFTVTLQPFEYNPNEKYTHKFMVQSIVIPDTATQQEIDSLVKCLSPYFFLVIILFLIILTMLRRNICSKLW